MTRDAYIKNLRQLYQLVAVLSDKNGCQVFRLRNPQAGKDLVLRSFPKQIPAYGALCDVRCENLPEIYDAIDLEDGQIVFEEFIDGITVSQVMEGGKYRYRGAKKVMTGVCNALHFLHRMGFVHRDVKPENVMINRDGRVILIDFNASRAVSDSTKDTVIMGTVGYVSPEQLGLSQSDARTDIYAAGILLNVMLTGAHPSVRLVRGRGSRIVRKCTHVSPDDRYQTALQLCKAL